MKPSDPVNTIRNWMGENDVVLSTQAYRTLCKIIEEDRAEKLGTLVGCGDGNTRVVPEIAYVKAERRHYGPVAYSQANADLAPVAAIQPAGAVLTEDQLLALVDEREIMSLWVACAYWGPVESRAVPFARAAIRAAIKSLPAASAPAQPEAKGEALDPMSMPLPCDIKVGICTHGKGTRLSSLVARMRFLNSFVDAYGPKSFRYDEEHPNDGLNAAPNAAELVSAHQPPGADVCAEMRALCSSCGGTGDVHGIDGEWRGSCDCEASAWSRAAAPQPSSTGSIADDTEFWLLVYYWSRAANDDNIDRTRLAIVTYIDTRTAALIDAASKERGGDAEDLQRLEFLIANPYLAPKPWGERWVTHLSAGPAYDTARACIDAERAIATTKAAK